MKPVVLAGIVVVVAIVLFFAFKSSSRGKGNQQRPIPVVPPQHISEINCSAIPNKYPNVGNRQTPPFFRCLSSGSVVCYDVGVSPLQKDGWYDMTQSGESCAGAPLCKDVASKCGLAGLASL